MKARQISQAADELQIFYSRLPQRCKLLLDIKNESLLCDVRTLVFLIVDITIFIKCFSFDTIINIISPVLTVIAILGIFLEISLSALKVELAFKQMNNDIQVQFAATIFLHNINCF